MIATWWATAPVVLGLPPSKGRKFYFIQGHESHLPTVPTDRADATWRFPLKKIVVSEWLATLARETFGDQTAICVPNGVDTKLFFAPIRTKQALPTIGFIYAPGKERGVDIAIAALAEAKRHVPELRVSSFGLTTPGGDLPLPSWVDFTLQPAQSMLRTLYASCDAFLRPNRIDGFGLPTLEAMACRTPVIATRAGAAPELLRRGGGHLLDSHSPEDMAAAISSVVRATELRWREWSDAAHATAMAYSWDEATKAFEAALHGG